jgi:hypothetical protein
MPTRNAPGAEMFLKQVSGIFEGGCLCGVQQFLHQFGAWIGECAGKSGDVNSEREARLAIPSAPHYRGDGLRLCEQNGIASCGAACEYHLVC